MRWKRTPKWKSRWLRLKRGEKKNGVEARHRTGGTVWFWQGWKTMPENIVVGERRGLLYVPGSVTHCWIRKVSAGGLQIRATIPGLLIPALYTLEYPHVEERISGTSRPWQSLPDFSKTLRALSALNGWWHSSFSLIRPRSRCVHDRTVCAQRSFYSCLLIEYSWRTLVRARTTIRLRKLNGIN